MSYRMICLVRFTAMGPIQCLSPKTSITPLMVMACCTLCHSKMARPNTEIGLFGPRVLLQSNKQAKHWNGGVAAWDCGHPEESRQHLFWGCPRWVAVRAGFLDGKSVESMTTTLPKVTLEHGLPTFLPEVVEWRNSLPIGAPGRGRLPFMVYTDGSAMHPKDVHLRVAGWSIAWRDEDGTWTSTGGRCPGQQSAARAEIEALVQVCRLASAPCIITSDCKGAVLGFRAVLNAVQNGHSLPKHLAKDSCADLWQALFVALKGAPRMAIRWMPAHCTKEELCARGGSEEDWTGNDEADQRAKQEARQCAPPEWLVQARGRQLDKEGAAMRMIS